MPIFRVVEVAVCRVFRAMLEHSYLLTHWAFLMKNFIVCSKYLAEFRGNLGNFRAFLGWNSETGVRVGVNDLLTFSEIDDFRVSPDWMDWIALDCKIFGSLK